MTSKDLHTAILDSNFTVGKRYIGRCSQVYRGKKAIHVACSETYTKVSLNKFRSSSRLIMYIDFGDEYNNFCHQNVYILQ